MIQVIFIFWRNYEKFCYVLVNTDGAGGSFRCISKFCCQKRECQILHPENARNLDLFEERLLCKVKIFFRWSWRSPWNGPSLCHPWTLKFCCIFRVDNCSPLLVASRWRAVLRQRQTFWKHQTRGWSRKNALSYLWTIFGTGWFNHYSDLSKFRLQKRLN